MIIRKYFEANKIHFIPNVYVREELELQKV